MSPSFVVLCGLTLFGLMLGAALGHAVFGAFAGFCVGLAVLWELGA